VISFFKNSIWLLIIYESDVFYQKNQFVTIFTRISHQKKWLIQSTKNIFIDLLLTQEAEQNLESRCLKGQF
jgi:hypothetical protein